MDRRSFSHIYESRFGDGDEGLGKKFSKGGALELFFGKKEKKITQEDVANYAAKVLDYCKNQFDSKRISLSLAFIIHSLSSDVLWDTFAVGPMAKIMFGDKDTFSKETEIALQRLRTGILDEIKKQINTNDDYKMFKASDFFMTEVTNFNADGHVGQVSGGDGKKHYLKSNESPVFDRLVGHLKDDREDFFKSTKSDLGTDNECVYLFLPQISDQTSAELLTEKRKLITLGDLLNVIMVEADKIKTSEDVKKIEENLALCIKMVADFASACSYIQSKGYVLMDIDKENIGYDLESERGGAFDFDGVVKIGHKLGDWRLHKYSPHKDRMLRGSVVQAGEMVFQLGVALGKVVTAGETFFDSKILNQLKSLCLRMRDFNSQSAESLVRSEILQPPINEVVNQLDEIYSKLKTAL